MSDPPAAQRLRSPRHRPLYRLIGFCVLAGVVGGLAALGFERLVSLAERLLVGGVGGYHPPATGTLTGHPEAPTGWSRLWIPVATTLGGLASGFLVYRFAPETAGHGSDAAIAAYHRAAGSIRARVPAVKALASALTIGSGGVAGKEGPAAQISVGLGSLIARTAGLRGFERRILPLASMAAGLAAIFQAPLGMAIFSVEVLYSGMVFESEALIYTIIAAVTGYAVFGLAEGWSPIFAIPEGVTEFTPGALPAFALLGVLAGLGAAALPPLLYGVQGAFRRLPAPATLKPAIGGLAVGLLAVAVPGVLGTGYGWIELSLAGQLSLGSVLVLLLLKGPAMALTIGSGGSGGVFAPTLTIGGLLGAALGIALGATGIAVGAAPGAFVIVGMAAVFSAAARTPISTLIMVAEMTGGYGLIVPAMLANVLAFLVHRAVSSGRRHPTLYESQVEAREDSPTHQGVFVRRALELLDESELEIEQLRLPRLVSLLRYGEPIAVGDRGLLAGLAVHAGSAAAGRTIAEAVGRVPGAVAVALLRADELIVPRGSTVIEAGDQLLVVATDEALGILRTAVAAP